MLQLFYKYIVDELLMGYFDTHSIETGSRYFIIIDNEKYRKGVLETMRTSNYSTKIDITNIFSNEGTSVKEETYSTFTLKSQGNNVPLIIGDSSNATDDYLTTLRNAVGAVDSDYRNYGILYILSNNRLESLTTTCEDLQAVGMPLNTEYIKNNITQKIEHIIANSYEKKYLQEHLNILGEKIGDGGCSLFDFKEILSVLQKGGLSGFFSSLGYFEDSCIYDMFYEKTEKEFQKRIEQNAFLYNKISDIFYHADDEDKVTLLSKYLDEKSADKLSKYDDLSQVDFDTIIQGVNKKNASSKITIEDIELVGVSSSAEVIKRTIGNYEKKSNNFLLVCSTNPDEKISIKTSFNIDIKDYTKSKGVNGRFLVTNLDSEFTYIEVGKDDNIHKFFIKRVGVQSSFFSDIQHFFKITKKGLVTIEVPDDVDKLKLGSGNHEVFVPAFGTLTWDDEYYLNVPLENGDDSGKFDFAISFGKEIVDFSFKLNNNRTVPKSAIALFELIWTKKITFKEVQSEILDIHSFSKVFCDDEEYSVYENFRKYLILEKQFVDTRAFSLVRKANETDFHPIYVDIPVSINSALCDIYAYFAKKQTIPSLTYIDEELSELYAQYLYAVYYHLNRIPENRTMQKNELGVTHLGIVEDNDIVKISPFHPLMIAYMLEFNSNFDSKTISTNILKLISPSYLLPYFYFEGNRVMRPYISLQTEDIKTWMFYENVNKVNQIKTFDITSKMVFEKMSAFIANFSYLFKDINSPIIISTIGISNDSTVLKGILHFIKEQYVKNGSVQKIELHEYVENLLDETFFEKLNRLNSDEVIIEELKSIGVEIEKKNVYTAREIIRLLFTRVSFYKHCLDIENPDIKYCHIAFYMMNASCEYITPPATDMRVEMSMNGLISIPSTVNTGTDYNIGFGANGLKDDGIIYKIISAVNTLYANARNDGRNQYQKNICTAKRFSYHSYELLDKIYVNANWVTFLNPEVDIDFFYKQDLYVVHYSDQFTINAKYDSITVTKHIHQYENMLSLSYERYTNSKMNLDKFNKTMKDYFNSLNGSWLLGMINKSEVQIREKLSIVAASIVMKHFLSRIPNVFWIPISLEEILRVSGAIGLPKDNSIFSAKVLGEKGAFSDDLLMLGLGKENSHDILYLYPVEVKIAKKDTYKEKGEKQIIHTFKVLQEHLVKGTGFENNIYKTFFASQLLTNADKLHANELISDEEFEFINSSRFNLLNLRYEMTNDFLVSDVGKAALVYFHDNSNKAINTTSISNVPICHIDLPQKDCFECIAGSDNQLIEFLSSQYIHVVDKVSTDPVVTPSANAAESNTSSLTRLQYDFSEEQLPKVANSFVGLDNTEKSEIKTSHAHNLLEDVTDSSINKNSIQIIVGKSKSTCENVIFEPNNTMMVSHPNMGIIGTMGTGKTQFARSVIAQTSKEGRNNIGNRPVGMLVFDYKGDYKDKKFLDTVGGHCYRYNYPFNPLKLVVTEEVDGMNLPAITANRISDSFGKAFGLGIKQQSAVKKLIIDTYEEFGITKDSSTWTKSVPTMNNVIDKFFEEYDANDSVYALFSTLNDYSIFTDSNDECVSLFEWLNCVRVIDLTLYPDDAKKLIVSLILDLFYAEMKQLGESVQSNGYRELRALIMVDEAHQFLKKDFTSLRNIISEGRMFGVGMILSTQNIGDFKTPKEDYSQFILSWVIHHVNSINKSEMQSIFGQNSTNTDKYAEYINKAQIFESICKIGSRVVAIRDLPFFELVEKDDRFIEKNRNYSPL